MLARTILALILFTVANCVIEKQKHFYKLHNAPERKRINCPELFSYRDPSKTLTKCLEIAALFDMNVVYFEETSQKSDDNMCRFLRCDGDLEVVDSEENGNYDIYINGAESDKLMCSADQDRFLSCWTCIDAANDEACYRHGTLRACSSPNAVCHTERVKNRRSVVESVTRGCYDKDLCKPEMWGSLGYINDMPTLYTEDTLPPTVTVEHCQYGPRDLCYDIKPYIERHESLECRNGWIHFIHAHDGKAVGCNQIVTSKFYSLENCKDLACIVGGNVIAVRNYENCNVYRCATAKGPSDGDLMLQDIDHGYDIFGSSTAYKCNKQTEKTFACRTCNEKTEEECARKGGVKDCNDGEEVCVHEREYDVNGDVSRVKRGCGKYSSCTPPSWNADITATCVPGTNGKSCRRCLYDTPGADHGCHEKFNKESLNIISKFKRVKLDTTDAPETKCRQVYQSRYHWVESCLDLAGQLSANMVNFRGTLCEIYSCDSVQKPIFHRTPGRRAEIYYMAK